MSILLLLIGIETEEAAPGPPPPPPAVVVAAGGTITFVPSKRKRQFRTYVPDVIRPTNWAEVITYEDEDVVVLL